LGKPYASEVAALPSTYSWGLSAEVGRLARWVRSSARLPLLAVGSGGSLTSAHLAALLHTRFTGRLAKAVTPLDLVHSPVYLPDLAVLLLTASGGNTDILSCVDQTIHRHPARLGVVCARKGSPLAERMTGFPNVCLEDFNLPVGKDGFLATNSLLATAVLLARAYAEAFSVDQGLPESLAELLHPGATEEEFRADLEHRCRPLWNRDTLVVLHGVVTLPAAVDLESKCTEAALGHVQIADYRNFAHGRYHWLARHERTVAVLALTSHEDRALAEKTLRLLPEGIPAVQLDFPATGVPAALAALAAAIHIVGLAGPVRGIDPGRPRVPPFGRKLYHLNALRAVPLGNELTEEETAAIERKAGASVITLAAQGHLPAWRTAYVSFRDSLRSASFGAVVLDYDGTLCGTSERFAGPSAEVARHLTELLRAGVWLGVATGRGKSVRKDLQRILVDRCLWQRVLIGYHNGGEIGYLGDDAVPSAVETLDESLQPLLHVIRANPRLSQLVKCEASRKQVTLELTDQTSSEEVWELVERLTRLHGPGGVTILRSSHSIDILAPRVSKRVLVERVRAEISGAGGDDTVLCIGDKGRWPGNDFDLLDGPFSLSVDEVSDHPNTCWNLAPAGTRCVEATLTYFGWMRAANGRVHLEL
jgi:fructoselysine-6-P-deglycase FrlB-like protein/hydroxymethylpyrimidine pyrophosphatase-like HAD family hydrolase